ncbi:MAG: ATP-dependent transcriptional regulator, MalT-like, LuxR family [Pseudonocardiales bacterium]|nr:ATP-dependent transcriptional regulator, MalT-like, LuxR family [Pseudonocardiales bacterium]
MLGPLLGTKLYLPRRKEGMVARDRLVQRLERGAAEKLLLVSAPAGFGKTTLLTDWLSGAPFAAGRARRAAWLSLDRSDNDPRVFWTYVVAALHSVEAGAGRSEPQLVALDQPPTQVLLTALLNDLGSTGDDIVLILDDYHVIDAPEIHDGIAFLLDHMPPRLHVVISSRADPAIPLARLRARGELVEVRAANLRFTPDEAAAYLNGTMGLQLTHADVAALDARTEGWIAALQLAALSIQGRDDAARYIAGFTGDDRYIVDYLVEEVLQRLPADVREFVLHVSLLDRFNSSLCAAVTGSDTAKATLDTLEQANLFLVSLDDRREWYRYHHLFADMLRSRLTQESPAVAAQIHRRASDWYAANGEPAQAVEHAMAGGHLARAADLIELAIPQMRRDRQEAALRRWCEALPLELLRARPVLSNSFAGALLSTGETRGVDGHLLNAERWLDPTVARRESVASGAQLMVVVDEDEFRRVPAGVAVHRAGLALFLGDPAGTVSHARRAMDLLEEGDELGRGAATALIALASWGSGDLETARDAYTKTLVSMERAGHIADILGCSIALADIQITQGRLRDAMRTYQRALLLATSGGGPPLRGTPDMYVGMSAIHREGNDIEGATELLARSRELGEHVGLPQNPYRWRVAMARVREAEADLDGAAGLLDEAEGVYVGDFSPNVRPVAAMRARIHIKLGRIADASDWARGQQLSTADDLSYLREYDHITLARALLARCAIQPTAERLDVATSLLGRLLDAAEAGGRTGSAIELLILQAQAFAMKGSAAAALVPLERALLLAEPEGYVRAFVDGGSSISSLLSLALKRGIAGDYVGDLLAAFGPIPQPVPARQAPIHPLSERELQILRLLGGDLGGPEIARQLVVSLNTVRTHTKSIYSKLGVNDRRAAVRRGEELGLMSWTRDRPGRSSARGE